MESTASAPLRGLRRQIAVDRTDRARAFVAASRALLGRGDGELHLGRYRLGRLIGRGAQGSVYRARDARLQRDVAIKTLRDSHPASLERLRGEARALAAIPHPNIVTIYDVGWLGFRAAGVDEAPRFCVVMELVDAGNMRRWLSRSRDVAEIVAVVQRVAIGLGHAHRHDIVHGDIKPENLLVSDTGRPRVVDFGLATALTVETTVAAHEPRPHESRPRGGTLPYMAPEVVAGAPPRPASDQYALCRTLLEALTGRAPDDGAALPRHLASLPAAGRRYAPVLERGLEDDPSARFESMEQLADALDLRQRRHRSLAVVLGLAAIPLGAVALAGEDRACRDRLHLGDTWDETRRAGVRASFGAEEGGSTSSLARVEARLDAFVAEYTRAADQVCADASLSSGEACLLEQRERIATALTLLGGGLDSRIEGRDRLLRLPVPLECVSSARHADPVTRAAMKRSAQALRELHRAVAGNRLDEAERAADRAVDASEGSARAQALSLLERGRLHRRRARPNPAEQDLGEAFDRATEANADGLAATIGAELLDVLARAGDEGSFARWDGLVTAAVERVDDDTARGRVLAARGTRAFHDGDPRRALALLRRAVADLPADSPFVAPTSLSLAGVLGEVGHDQEAETTLLVAVARLQRERFEGEPMLTIAFANASALYKRRGMLEEAQRWGRLAVRSGERGSASNPEMHAKALLNLAAAQMEAGDFEAARINLEQASLALPRGDGPALRGMIEANLGMVALYAGDVVGAERALRAALRGMTEREGAGHPRTLQIARLLSRVLRESDRPGEAAEVSGQAVRDAEAALGETDQVLGNALVEWGTALSELGEHRTAIDAVTRALEIFEALGAVRDAATARFSLGVCRYYAGQHAEGITQAAGATAEIEELEGRSPAVVNARAWLAEVDEPDASPGSRAPN